MLAKHTPRFKVRRDQLDAALPVLLLESVWKKFVREGFKKQDILDLHDYYDFHRNRVSNFDLIRGQLIEGNYYCKTAYVTRVEKKLGVCRHLQIPSPEDAVLLQALVEVLAPSIEKNQPSKRAYYSRSHRAFKTESDIDETFPYEWWELWPKFQERIYEFAKTFKYIAVTDISNYYDNISFHQLRKVLSSNGMFHESILDFLFYLLETFVWKPDYLPFSGIGLPQVNFDAPRLLGHCFLFEIDQYLDEKSSGNFVRWMDDIDFGVDSMKEGKKILKDLDELLLTRGLRLNLGKTQIISAKKAQNYFLPDENRYLTIATKRIKYRINSGFSIDWDKEKIRLRFERFLKKEKIGRWEKVYLRYFTISTLTQDPFLEKYVPKILYHNPTLRFHALAYYLSLGITLDRIKVILKFFQSESCLDDKSVFYVGKLLVESPIDNSRIQTLIKNTALTIAGNSSTHFISSLWILCKYGARKDIVNTIKANEQFWKQSDFVARQVIASIPRYRSNTKVKNYVVETLIKDDKTDALKILYNLNRIRKEWHLVPGEKGFLVHGPRPPKVFPLNKFLLCLDVLTYRKVPAKLRMDLKNSLIKNLTDPVYMKAVNRIKIK